MNELNKVFLAAFLITAGYICATFLGTPLGDSPNSAQDPTSMSASAESLQAYSGPNSLQPTHTISEVRPATKSELQSSFNQQLNIGSKSLASEPPTYPVVSESVIQTAFTNSAPPAIPKKYDQSFVANEAQRQTKPSLQSPYNASQLFVQNPSRKTRRVMRPIIHPLPNTHSPHTVPPTNKPKPRWNWNRPTIQVQSPQAAYQPPSVDSFQAADLQAADLQATGSPTLSASLRLTSPKEIMKRSQTQQPMIRKKENLTKTPVARLAMIPPMPRLPTERPKTTPALLTNQHLVQKNKISEPALVRYQTINRQHPNRHPDRLKNKPAQQLQTAQRQTSQPSAETRYPTENLRLKTPTFVANQAKIFRQVPFSQPVAKRLPLVPVYQTSQPKEPSRRSQKKPTTLAPTTSIARMPEAQQSHIRTHLLRDGDTLPKIAQRYLKDASRAREIFLENQSVINHPDLLPIGVEIRIPETSQVANIPARNMLNVTYSKRDQASGLSAPALSSPRGDQSQLQFRHSFEAPLPAARARLMKPIASAANQRSAYRETTSQRLAPHNPTTGSPATGSPTTGYPQTGYPPVYPKFLQPSNLATQ